jgi:chromosome segregation ATPase
MNAIVEQYTETSLTPLERANAVLKSSDIELHFQSMANEAKEISTITNKDGYEQCHATRMKLREERVELNKKAKAARDDANAFSKAVIAEEKRLITIIEPEEERLQGLQTVWDAEVKRKKEEKARIEAERVRNITQKIDSIRLTPYNANNSIASAIVIQLIIDRVEKEKPDSSFEEFESDAIKVWEECLKALDELHARRVREEEEAAALKIEQERVKAETEALAKERAEHDAKVEQARKQEAARMAALEKAERAQQEAEEKTRKAEERNRLLQETVEAERKQSLANQAELDKHRELASGDKWSNEQIGVITNSDDFKKIFGEPEHEPNKIIFNPVPIMDSEIYGIKESSNEIFELTKENSAFQDILTICRTWRDYEFPRLAIEAIEKIAREQVEGN